MAHLEHEVGTSWQTARSTPTKKAGEPGCQTSRAAGFSTGPGAGPGRASPPSREQHCFLLNTVSTHSPGKRNGCKEFSNTVLDDISVLMFKRNLFSRVHPAL